MNLIYGIKCCYHCESRYPGCHAICPQYLEEKAKWEEEKKLIKANKIIILTNYDFDKITFSACKRHNIKGEGEIEIETRTNILV